MIRRLKTLVLTILYIVLSAPNEHLKWVLADVRHVISEISEEPTVLALQCLQARNGGFLSRSPQIVLKGRATCAIEGSPVFSHAFIVTPAPDGSPNSLTRVIGDSLTDGQALNALLILYVDSPQSLSQVLVDGRPCHKYAGRLLGRLIRQRRCPLL